MTGIDSYISARDVLIEAGLSEEDAQRHAARKFHQIHKINPIEAVIHPLKIEGDELENLTSINYNAFTILKSNEKEFIIYGPASVEIEDLEGDIIKMGAFNEALPQLFRRGRLTLNHGDTIIGEILEEYTGKDGQIYKTEVSGDVFYAVSNVWNDTQESKNARKEIKSDELTAYSISGTALKHKSKRENGNIKRVITKIDLSAITLCKDGANQGARFRIIKKLGEGKMAKEDKKPADKNPKDDEDVEKDVKIELDKFTGALDKISERLDDMEKTIKDMKATEKQNPEDEDEGEDAREEEDEEEDKKPPQKKKSETKEITKTVMEELKKMGVLREGSTPKPGNANEKSTHEKLLKGKKDKFSGVAGRDLFSMPRNEFSELINE